MEQLKQNKFWVGLAVAGVGLIVFYFVLVQGAQAEENQYRVRNFVGPKANLKKLEEAMPVPGKPDIESWEAYRGSLKAGYKTITTYFAKNDEALEVWFPRLTDPSRDLFMTEYRDKIKDLETELGKRGVKIGVLQDPDDEESPRKFGFNWEDPQEFWGQIPPEDEKKVLKDLQKRFWARKRVADVVLKSGAKVSRVHDFRFFKKLHGRVSAGWEAAPTGRDQVLYLGKGEESSAAFGFGITAKFKEYALPNGLGETLTFGFALELPYSQVPKVLESMLKPGTEDGLLFNVIGTRMTIRRQNPPEKTFVFKENNLIDKRLKEAAAQEEVKPVEVLLSVTCRMIDFDASQVKDFEAPPPAKAASTKAPNTKAGR